MKCPECDFVQSDRNFRCIKCGIILQRDQAPRKSTSKTANIRAEEEEVTEEGSFFQRFVFSVEPKVNPFFFGGRVLVFLIFFIWGWKFILSSLATNDVGNSFFHLVNLPFHEAGHLFFGIFGRWIGSLGGTLGQLLVPIICLVAFLIKSKNPFGASVSLWWLGENFMDIAPYMNDARKQELMLLGGVTGKEADYGYHDWEFILNEIGLLRHDHTLARLAHDFGILLMLLSFAWGGYLLYKQYRHLDVS